MAHRERAYLIGPSSSTVFQRMALDEMGHVVLNRGGDLAGSDNGLQAAIGDRMTLVLFTDSNPAEPPILDEVIDTVSRRAPEGRVLLFSYRSSAETPQGAILFKREGGLDEFFDLAKFVTRLPKPKAQ